MGKEYRTYHEECTHHVYCKAVDGNIIFYSVQDCLFYITLYYHLARHYRIIVRAFSLMPNHIHSNEQAPSEKQFLEFHKDLNRDFTQTYNKEHGRTGPIFMKPFGFASKRVGKKIRENIAYILNNAVVGNLVSDIEDYRWNLMAYRKSDHPFSNKIEVRHASRPLRRSITLLRYYYEKGLPLTYDRQRALFKSLSHEDSAQLTDYIIALHNCLDYGAISALYGGCIENAVTSAKINTGSEHDIPEDYEDYRVYSKMMIIARDSGVNLQICNFEMMPEEEVKRWANKFSRAGFPARQIRKFLHIRDQSRPKRCGTQTPDNQ